MKPVDQYQPWQKAHGRKRGHIKAWEDVWLEERLPELAVPPSDTREGLLQALGADPATARLWLEIGFGNGDYLSHLAALHPQDRFIGVEVFLEGIAGLLKRLEASGATNTRVCRRHAHELVEVLPPACLDRVIINFPDPWPKTRHHKRRIVQTGFIALLLPRLRPGARITLATDWAEYAQWMLETLEAIPELTNLSGPGGFAPPPADWITTRFEAKGRAAGREIFHLGYAALPPPPA